MNEELNKLVQMLQHNNEQTASIYDLLQGRLGEEGLVHKVNNLKKSQEETVFLLKEGEKKFDEHSNRIVKLEQVVSTLQEESGTSSPSRIVLTKKKLVGLFSALGLTGAASWWDSIVGFFGGKQ